jgi:hypothetical protein
VIATTAANTAARILSMRTGVCSARASGLVVEMADLLPDFRQRRRIFRAPAE